MAPNIRISKFNKTTTHGSFVALVVKDIQTIFPGNNDILPAGTVKIHDGEVYPGPFSFAKGTITNNVFGDRFAVPLKIIKPDTIIPSTIAPIICPKALPGN